MGLSRPTPWQWIGAAVILAVLVGPFAWLMWRSARYGHAETSFHRNAEVLTAAFLYHEEHGSYPDQLSLIPGEDPVPSYRRAPDGKTATVTLNRSYVVDLDATGWHFRKQR